MADASGVLVIGEAHEGQLGTISQEILAVGRRIQVDP